MTSVPSYMDEDATLARSGWSRPKMEPSTKTSAPKSTTADRHIKDLNKRLRVVYEDEDIEYGKDADMSTIVGRFAVATSLRKRRIEDVLQEINRARNVELCFLMDATGSMEAHIAGVRKYIFEIIRKLKKTRSGNEPYVQDIKMAMVGYRDFGDSPQIEELAFTSSLSKFTTFCEGLDATGGDDGPEDVFGGLDAALQLNWSPNAGTKMIFHIADAPCHGKEFHAGIRDNYPSGDPKGLKYTDLFSRLRSQGIQYHFGKITSHTDIMLKKFEEAYAEPITVFDVKDVKKIAEVVFTAVHDSVAASISCSKLAGRAVRMERSHDVMKTEPAWATLPTMTGSVVTFVYPACIEDIVEDVPLERTKRKKLSVQIAPNPFAKGAERVAYYGKDVSTYVEDKKGDVVKAKEELIVLKEYLHIGKFVNSYLRYELSNQMQTIAAFLAEKYVENIYQQMGLRKTVKFIKIRSISIENGMAPLRHMCAERRFSASDKFVRFTNNTGYNIMEERALALGVSMEFVQLVMAFSHWTYKATNRFLMVVDLEGIVGKMFKNGENGVLLTDPAIHCKDITRYGPMNHGPNGMKSFFRHHACNKFCEGLGLTEFVAEKS